MKVTLSNAALGLTMLARHTPYAEVKIVDGKLTIGQAKESLAMLKTVEQKQLADCGFKTDGDASTATIWILG